jgi:hypothetical protein
MSYLLEVYNMNTAKIYRLYIDGSYVDYYSREKVVQRIAKQAIEEGKQVQILEEEIPTIPVSFKIL